MIGNYAPYKSVDIGRVQVWFATVSVIVCNQLAVFVVVVVYGKDAGQHIDAEVIYDGGIF